jgi:hypothetical protein
MIAGMSEVEFELPASVVSAVKSGRTPVQAFREHRGLGVTALAQASGVPASAIVEHEQHGRQLSPHELAVIARALELPTELMLD